MKVEIDDEQLMCFFRTSLAETLGTMQEDLAKTKRGNITGVFSWDAKEEIKELKKHIKALKRVLEYYS